jgi:hypothetical protein
MGKDSFIKYIIQQGIVSEEDALFALTEQIGNIGLEDYYNLVRECKKNKIDAGHFFNSLYMNASEDVQYQMWKDGYVNSCPANRLIADITSEQSETVNLISNDYGEELIHCEAYFDGIQDAIVKYLLDAKQSIKIAMAWFTNPVIFNTLLRLCKRKDDDFEVTLLINNDLINNRPNGLPFDRLIQAGIKLHVAEPPTLIHHKFCIIDDQVVIDGSYNWTVLAEKNNDENIVVIRNGNTIDSFVDAFDSLIRKYERVYSMPARVPERPEYDCCSYRYYNSEEWLAQIEDIGSKKKQYDLYKEIFKVLPEQMAQEKIPSEFFESVKIDVDKEINRDAHLFNSSITTKNEELSKDLSVKERKIDYISHTIERISAQKTEAIKKFKSKIESIKSKKISQEQKALQIDTLRRDHRTKLNKLNRTIVRNSSELESLRSESEMITAQQNFINSIRDSNLEGSNGLCRINLKWNTADDLDLHLLLPNGYLDRENDIYFQRKRAEYEDGVCFLDHDAIPNNAEENPQENIIWEKALPDGKYRVYVKLYNKKSDLQRITFSITVFTGNYVKTELFHFVNPVSGSFVAITTLTFKNGKVITPIVFDK